MSESGRPVFEIIGTEALLPRVTELRRQGYRLVQIGATRLPEALELTYSFDREQRLLNLRLQVALPGRVPSITPVYWCAFLYENELHDLFNLQVDGIAVDFHGEFYHTAMKYAFGAPAAQPVRAPAPASQTSTQKNGDGVPAAPRQP